LYDLVEARFRRLVAEDPVLGTALGLHDGDGRWGDGSRDALLAQLDADRLHLTEIERLDPSGLSGTARFERDLERHNVRRRIFDLDVLRIWERRSTGLDAIGDGLFLGFARDYAPLAERLASLTERLDRIETFLTEHRTRAAVPQVRLWQEIELEAARHLPRFLDQIVAAAAGILDPVAEARLERAAERAESAIRAYADWINDALDTAVDEWAIGPDVLDEMISLRGFDSLDADAILEIGLGQLEEHKAARIAAAREIDPDASERDVVDRVKSDHPPSFEAALDAYRDVMHRARQHLIDHAIVTVPDDERLQVVETPVYLRNVVPFAAYFEPPKFDHDPQGIYIVTPSVGDDPNAMREHYWASISNTSIHEAYPGHHLQLAIAARHPSLTRLLADAPEFSEGWGMYSEQMMREEGFDDGPAFRLAMHTDAIWRACRIVLDIRMHRGELTVEEAIRFLVEHTGFERANARAEVLRYTYTPTYQLSYLLGKVLLLELRAEERARLGTRFSLHAFHDALLQAGTIPITFHRRQLDEGARRP
jgi:uncharacterized protein (DUF885 family)